MPEETADSLDLLDWVAKQPWSNGRVGLWGISYEGTRALLTGGGECGSLLLYLCVCVHSLVAPTLLHQSTHIHNHAGIAGHPAVTAVCPMYIFLDIFRDVGFIGGLHLSGFIKSWETYVVYLYIYVCVHV
jgi:hypothetical protein